MGELSIADLHSPAFDKVVTRDRHRIKTLARLSGVTADASLFWYLLGGKEKFDAIIPVDALTTDDLVEMAARVKRGIEREAVRVEERVRTELADARAQSAIAEAADITKPHDDAVLQAELERAIKGHTEQAARLESMQKEKREADESTKKADDARTRLESLGGGLTVTEAMTAKIEAKEALRESEDAYRDLNAKLALAQAEVIRRREALASATDAVSAAKREEELHAELHATINAAGSVGPTDEEIAEQILAVSTATTRVREARSAVTAGVQIRAAIAAQAKAEEMNTSARLLKEQATRLRDAATDTADVLTAAISKLNDCPLKIALNDDGDPRLVVATDRSEFEPFDELSDGERWVHVVQIAAAANRLIVLPQAAFGELSPSSREQLHQLAVQHNCYILSAVAADCALHGESYSDHAGMQAAE